jgi:broad specificity phosphatase PhoE
VSGRLVLVRHGQSHGNVERRLDTRPPGAALTDLGRNQARAFARDLRHPAGMIAHSVAVRAAQTAEEISGGLGLDPLEFEGIHEVQVGDLEDRNDDDAIAAFETVYQRWHQGDLDVAMPGGETGNEVLDRYVPVLTQLRLRYLDDAAWRGDIVVVSHGAAIRLVSAVLAGVDGSCVQWSTLTPPFYPEPDVHPVEDALSSADPMG